MKITRKIKSSIKIFKIKDASVGELIIAARQPMMEEQITKSRQELRDFIRILHSF